jgi:hypothetical protein
MKVATTRLEHFYQVSDNCKDLSLLLHSSDLPDHALAVGIAQNIQPSEIASLHEGSYFDEPLFHSWLLLC